MADIHIFPAAKEGTPQSAFVHLHVHSDYSLLDGAAKIDTLIEKAKELNMKALALTDHGNMFGALNFEHTCRANGINPIIGEEFYVAQGDAGHTEQKETKYGGKYYHLVLLCKNATGYKNMAWLSSLAYKEGFYNKPRIDFNMLRERHEGLICLTACIQGELPQMLLHGDDEAAEKLVRRYAELFGKDNYYIEIQDHGLPEQKTVAKKLIAIAHKTGVPLVLTNDVHYCNKEDAKAQEVLQCIGFKKTLSEPHRTMGDGRTEWYLKTDKEMASLFPDCPEVMENTIKIANMCRLVIPQYKTEELKDCLPCFDFPKSFPTQNSYVLHLVEKGLRKRYPKIMGSPAAPVTSGEQSAAPVIAREQSDRSNLAEERDCREPLRGSRGDDNTEAKRLEIIKRAMYELGIIFDMGFSGYFLVVWEFIHWAKEHKKPIGPGRGSGAGSLVAYAMEITDIDPLRFHLIFERFLNPERVSMPDFDVDMDYDYRQDIIAHTRELYGEAQVGHIVTFGTLKAKAAITDVGRVLGIPLQEVNMLKKGVPDSPKAKLKDAFTPADEAHPDNGRLIEYRDDPRYKELFDLCFKLENVNRNTSLHASGMVIARSPLPDWAPVLTVEDKSTGQREAAVQYTMDVIEPCGLVKMDYLGLKTLSLIRYAEDIINRHKTGDAASSLFSASEVRDDDAKTFDLFCRGDTSAVFQFESAGMQKILRQAKPRKLEEIVALNALYRPGPMDYIPQYIEGKWHPETVHYPDECLKGILEETYGVMVYQEQVMQVAQRIAGFSLGGADMLRRAMGKKKKDVLMGKKKEFIDGAVKNGFSEKHADEIFEIMVPFAGYGFNKSHAAAYSVVAYRTAYLKCHYPAEFMAANLTNEITSTDKLPVYIAEARRMGIAVDAPDINRSDKTFDVVSGHIVFGLCGVKGVGLSAAQSIIDERESRGEYKSFIDFLERCVPARDDSGRQNLNSRTIESLIKTGAFDKLGLNRPTMLSNLEAAMEYASSKAKGAESGQEDLFGGTSEKTFADFTFKMLDDIPRMEKLNQERELIGSYVSGHPLDDYKSAIDKAVTLTSANIAREARNADEAKAARKATGASDWQVREAGRVLVALGIVLELRTIRTKKGDEMAFGKLQDYSGTFDMTFFPKVWTELRGKVHQDGIYAFSGRVDTGRDAPSLMVETLEDVDTLQSRSITEVHIQLEGFKDAGEVAALKSFLFEKTGPCKVSLHIDVAGTSYTVGASSPIGLPSDDGTVAALKDLPFVKDVWLE